MKDFNNLFLSIVLSILFSLCLNAQGTPTKNIQEELSFIDALDIYEKTAEEDLLQGKENPKLFLRLARSYYYNARYDSSYKWYQHYYNIKNVKPDLVDNYRYGQVLKVKGEHDNADALLATYYEFKGIRYKGYQNIKQKEEIENTGARYTMQSFNNNSIYSEYPAFIVGSGLYLVASYDADKNKWSRKATSDIFYLDKGQEKMVELEGDVNTEYNEGSLVITKDGKTMYFSRNDYVKGKLGKTRENVVTINLYRAELVNGSWKKITSLPFNSEDYSVGHPALSNDEKTLYFISDQPGARGETDLYSVPIYEDGSFGKPKNMADINTVAKEMFPFIDSEGVLYFASDREASMGGMDVFMSPLEVDQTYKKVFNVGDEINSQYDDFAYVVGKDGKGYYSSNKVNDVGGDDIYGFIENNKFFFPTFVELNGVARTFQGSNPIEGLKITLIDNNDNVLESAITNEMGEYKFSASDTRKMAYVMAEKKGYKTLEKTIPPDIISGKNETLDLNLVPMVHHIPENITINGYLKDAKTGKPIANATVNLLDLDNNELATVKTDNNGKYIFTGIPSKEAAFVRVQKDNYQTEEKELNTQDIQNGNLDLDFRMVKGYIPVELGSDLTSLLNTIYFDYGKSNIRPDASAELDKIIQVLKKFPTLSIEIGSHTDSRGHWKFNSSLSKRRALATYNYLIKAGIRPNRLKYRGYGESKLLNKCDEGVYCSEQMHQLNRRSSFIIIKQ